MNRFTGINPHLNSFLQQPDGGWETFHARHISDLASALDFALPENYYAVEEKSLQINALADPRPTRTVPDITVYQTHKDTESKATSTASPTMIFPLLESFEEDEEITAVVIYRVQDGKVPGTTVTRIELLSPANKPPGTYHREYLLKRQQTLKSGLCMVEIDYLHESRPYLDILPSYPDGDDNALPYLIVISDPRPNIAQGETRVYGAHVDQPLPTIPIPLADDDRLLLDFDTIYNTTFASRRLFGMVVDYTQNPVNFNRYNADDQQRIRERLTQITR